MVKMILEIEGMVCGMCESHVNDTIRRTFPVKKVRSSHSRGETELVAEQPIEEEALRKAIAETGYTVRSIRTEPYDKKGKRKLSHNWFGGIG